MADYSNKTFKKDLGTGTFISAKGSVREQVKKFARTNNITYVETPEDRFGNVVTKMAGDVVKLDDTSNLLLALRRTNKIPASQAITMLSTHLREKRQVATQAQTVKRDKNR